MRRYRFRLEPVLRVRRIEEDRAVGELASARRVAAEAEALVAERRARCASRPVLAGAVAVDALLADRFLADAAVASLVAASEARRAADERVEDRRVEWAEAAARTSALQRLDERRRAEHDAEEARQEALAVDDLVTSRHGRSHP